MPFCLLQPNIKFLRLLIVVFVLNTCFVATLTSLAINFQVKISDYIFYETILRQYF